MNHVEFNNKKAAYWRLAGSVLINIDNRFLWLHLKSQHTVVRSSHKISHHLHVDNFLISTCLPTCGRNVHDTTWVGKTDSGAKATLVQNADFQPLSLHFIGLLAEEWLSQHRPSLMASHDKQPYIFHECMCVHEKQFSLITQIAFHGSILHKLRHGSSYTTTWRGHHVRLGLLLLRQSSGPSLWCR